MKIFKSLKEPTQSKLCRFCLTLHLGVVDQYLRRYDIGEIIAEMGSATTREAQPRGMKPLQYHEFYLRKKCVWRDRTQGHIFKHENISIRHNRYEH